MKHSSQNWPFSITETSLCKSINLRLVPLTTSLNDMIQMSLSLKWNHTTQWPLRQDIYIWDGHTEQLLVCAIYQSEHLGSRFWHFTETWNWELSSKISRMANLHLSVTSQSFTVITIWTRAKVEVGAVSLNLCHKDSTNSLKKHCWLCISNT